MPAGSRQYPRAERVRAAIKEVLAAEVDRLRDPGLGFVTITDVTLTPDLRHAKAYFTVLGEPVERASSRDALARATKRLRTAVAHQVRLRYAPTLEMVEDPVPERTARLDSIIAELHEGNDE
jgi:ribosome-binding factor A